jgi:hypothetical protein
MCFYDCDDGYTEFCTEKDIKVRTEHRCEACLQAIPPGQYAHHRKGKFEGEFFSIYVCQPCRIAELSIVARELKEGCPWHTAWCPIDELVDYLNELDEPLEMLQGTPQQCYQQVIDIEKAMRDSRKAVPA